MSRDESERRVMVAGQGGGQRIAERDLKRIRLFSLASGLASLKQQ
jgi:hypothetical protein